MVLLLFPLLLFKTIVKIDFSDVSAPTLRILWEIISFVPVFMYSVEFKFNAKAYKNRKWESHVFRIRVLISAANDWIMIFLTTKVDSDNGNVNFLQLLDWFKLSCWKLLCTLMFAWSKFVLLSSSSDVVGGFRFYLWHEVFRVRTRFFIFCPNPWISLCWRLETVMCWNLLYFLKLNNCSKELIAREGLKRVNYPNLRRIGWIYRWFWR